MHTIRACMENGDSIITRINATPEEIARYYIGRAYIYEDGERGEIERTRFSRVEYLDEQEAEK